MLDSSPSLLCIPESNPPGLPPLIMRRLEKAPASYRAISGPPKSQKSQKRVKKESPGPSVARGQKSPKRVKKESKMTLFDSFLTLF